jgi:hypothetical protein
MNQTNIQGTPGQVRVISVDPNNVRIALDSTTTSGVSIKPGTYNQVTVDSTGRVVSGQFVQPIVTVPVKPVGPAFPSDIDARQGDYGGTTPNWTPTGGKIGLAFDIGTIGGNRQWWYIAGTWL